MYIGPMWAGKSTKLIQRYLECQSQGLKVEMVKPRKDTRSLLNYVVTHDNVKVPATTVNNIHELSQKNSADGYFIDELHMFDDVLYCHTLADMGKLVVVCGLDQGLHLEPFQPLHQLTKLIPKAEIVEKLSSRCACTAPASFTIRITPIPENGSLVGGEKDYRSVCRGCYTLAKGWVDGGEEKPTNLSQPPVDSN